VHVRIHTVGVTNAFHCYHDMEKENIDVTKDKLSNDLKSQLEGFKQKPCRERPLKLVKVALLGDCMLLLWYCLIHI
jgi:hypothetical protein